jgi:hypothetical protein
VSELETLARKRFNELTAAETSLLQNSCTGTLAVCGPTNNLNADINDPAGAEEWGNDRSIRGELIGWLCANREAVNFVDHGGVQIFGARIDGPIELLSVTVQFPLVFASCMLCGDINLQSAHIRTLSFTRTHIQSIYADGVVISGAFFLRNSCAGLLQFAGARVEGQFDCDGSKFAKLILDGATVGVGLLLRRVEGVAKMSGARVATDLDCGGATFTATAHSSGCALDAEGIKVEGSVLLRTGFHAFGLVKLHGAQVGINIDCTGAEFALAPQVANRGGEALTADLVVVRGTVFLSQGFHARGAVNFTSAQITGDFTCDDATFDVGLRIERASIQGTFFWRKITLGETAGLDIINTSADSLTDDRTSWPQHSQFELHGFAYRRIDLSSPRNATERLDWLARQRSFAAQPYRQLARVLQDEGDDAGAQQVLYQMEHLRRSSETGIYRRIWNLALRVAIGYGYRPWSALRWFIILVFLGFVLFSGGFYSGSMVPTDKDAYAFFMERDSVPDYYERFHASIYSLENAFPLVKLGQTDRWQPDPACRSLNTNGDSAPFVLLLRVISPAFLRWFRWLQLLLGWFLATMWIVAVTGLIRRER